MGEAIRILHQAGVSQLPVTDDQEFVGSLTDSKLLKLLIENPEIKDQQVSEVMEPPFQFVALDNTVDVLSSILNKDNPALLVRDEQNQVHIITKEDLLIAISGG